LPQIWSPLSVLPHRNSSITYAQLTPVSGWPGQICQPIWSKQQIADNTLTPHIRSPQWLSTIK